MTYSLMVLRNREFQLEVRVDPEEVITTLLWRLTNKEEALIHKSSEASIPLGMVLLRTLTAASSANSRMLRSSINQRMEFPYKLRTTSWATHTRIHWTTGLTQSLGLLMITLTWSEELACPPSKHCKSKQASWVVILTATNSIITKAPTTRLKVGALTSMGRDKRIYQAQCRQAMETGLCRLVRLVRKQASGMSTIQLK